MQEILQVMRLLQYLTMVLMSLYGHRELVKRASSAVLSDNLSDYVVSLMWFKSEAVHYVYKMRPYPRWQGHLCVLFISKGLMEREISRKNRSSRTGVLFAVLHCGDEM